MQFTPFIPLLLAMISAAGAILVARSGKPERRELRVRIDPAERRR
ncbi:hypothetical protein [Profundibacterium mesophilum]|uniref:Uncharacterized protein n=1 Tax=Profundibacterium mesophilum KAUST100406-0324 TaxID=1037889 RepID=A0A921NZ00_9RHOB|nr:hypothetical protein [Profundibacterium mesophilum]KAF0677274.1 hypothetical protein PMES_00321 [Profundibacterium mesophilum KAUST100406-0324]